MARLNVSKGHPHGLTHEGAPAAPMNTEQALRRSVMSCMLWEKTFYEDGEDIAVRIKRLASSIAPEKLAALAVEVRTKGNMRHAPLLLLSVLAQTGRGKRLVSEAITQVIQRPDELAEFLAIHARINGVTPDKIKPKLSSQMKKGLARAFGKFNEYGLAKYVRDNSASPVKMRDVLFLSHAKPKDEAQDQLWKRLIAGELTPPDTWEVALSAGADKKETFERLIKEGKLGYFALLRNLRNMLEAGCDLDLVTEAILARKGGAEKILPFRYVAAARAAKQLEPAIDKALCAAIAELPTLPGKTILLVDVSGSMDMKLSGKSDMNRIDAAAALASMWPGDARVFTFSSQTVEVPPRRGMAGVDAIMNSQSHGSTMLGTAMKHMNQLPHDRLIVITDEQSHEAVERPVAPKAYMINVASNQHGVGYGSFGTKPSVDKAPSTWVHIDGFSESVLRFIYEFEQGE